MDCTSSNYWHLARIRLYFMRTWLTHATQLLSKFLHINITHVKYSSLVCTVIHNRRMCLTQTRFIFEIQIVPCPLFWTRYLVLFTLYLFLSLSYYLLDRYRLIFLMSNILKVYYNYVLRLALMNHEMVTNNNHKMIYSKPEGKIIKVYDINVYYST